MGEKRETNPFPLSESNLVVHLLDDLTNNTKNTTNINQSNVFIYSGFI
jgi:hypothetical protein